jgi:hypothetical protein
MDVAIDPIEKISSMNSLKTIKQDTQVLVFSLLLTNVTFTLVAYFWGDSRIALNVACASVFLTLNLIFYMVLAAAILVKKNIAWMGPVIVIKYLILIGSVYLVWANCDVLLVLASMFTELLTTIFLLVVVKKWLSRRDK